MMKTVTTQGLGVEVTQQRDEEHGLWVSPPGLKSLLPNLPVPQFPSLLDYYRPAVYFSQSQ